MIFPSSPAFSFRRFLFFLCIVLVVPMFYQAHSQTNSAFDGTWYLEMEHRDLGATRFPMDFATEGNQEFSARTRKQALNKIIGTRKALLIRTLSNAFRGGSLVRIEKGTYRIVQDSLMFEGVMRSALGQFGISGFVYQGRMQASLTDTSQKPLGQISGSRENPNLPSGRYQKLFKETASVTHENIYNRDLLSSANWKKFSRKMEKVTPKLRDDLEMIFAFFYYKGQLPISHYMLSRPIPDDPADSAASTGSTTATVRNVSLQEIQPGTACLKVSSFGGSSQEMNAVFDTIVSRNYRNLIVDLRDNPGGSIDAGMAFATRVADAEFYGGVFLTQKYFDQHQQPPLVAAYDQFPHFTESNYDLLMHGIHNTNGLCLKVIPREPVFKGRLFIITNGRTASTCEPIVYGLKQRRRATIVGTTTAGAMLAAEPFALSDGFQLFLPTADYYTIDGFRIDQKGVSPDVEVQDDALDFVRTQLISD